ncbi:hypothetical protein HGRIS_007074 [Hohenbuehelia grisea]|uniref:BTB domain-containing protein n=1 Tax=Hohenbuehelia grisea TaxID=104357 RepID=A0ABR3JAX7_9AGAR
MDSEEPYMLSVSIISSGLREYSIQRIVDDYEVEDDLENSHASEQPLRHPSYYLEDGNTIFLAGKILFKIHKHFLLEHSPVFSDILSLPEPESGEGLSDETPIVLQQVLARDFASIMWLFYNPSIDTYKATISRWIGILALSDRYQMDVIKSLAVRYLRDMALDPIEKIVLHQRYDLDDEWAMDAYIKVSGRSDPLVATEAERIGFRVSTLISKAREELMRYAWYRSSGGGHRGHSFGTALNQQPTHLAVHQRNNYHHQYSISRTEEELIRKIMQE